MKNPERCGRKRSWPMLRSYCRISWR
jgi:hypothetical protein